MTPAPDKTIAMGSSLVQWYEANKRDLPWRRDKDPYSIWVSEVMLQQTQVKTMVPYYLKFMEQYPRIQDLASADLETILKSWEGLGYYARARNLHRAAGVVVNEMDGNIPHTHAQFLSLPGVGDYIAAAVLSIAFDQAHAVVDGNVKRVLARLFCLDAPVNHQASLKIFKQLADTMLETDDPGTFNQAVMELGALVCTPKNPDCAHCPLTKNCRAYASNRVDEFPVRVKKKKVPTYHIAIGIVRKDNKLLITRRKLDGLLGGLWEFPGGKVDHQEAASDACIREILEETGIHAGVDRFLTRVFHAYTHFKIEMDVFYCNYISGKIALKGPIDHKWVQTDELERYPFPRANLKFIPLITQSPRS